MGGSRGAGNREESSVGPVWGTMPVERMAFSTHVTSMNIQQATDHIPLC